MVSRQLRDRASFKVTTALDFLSLSFRSSTGSPSVAVHGGAFAKRRILDLSRFVQRHHCPVHLASSEADCAIGEGAILSLRGFPSRMRLDAATTLMAPLIIRRWALIDTQLLFILRSQFTNFGKRERARVSIASGRISGEVEEGKRE